MTINEKINLLEEEFFNLISSRINEFHNNRLSRVAFLNALMVIPNEFSKYNCAHLFNTANRIEEFENYISGQWVTSKLINFYLKEDMSFYYELGVTLCDEYMEIKIDANTKKISASKKGRKIFRKNQDLLDRFIKAIQSEISFGTLTKIQSQL